MDFHALEGRRILIRFKLHRQLKEIVKSATISCHSTGKYSISLLCEEEVSKLFKSNSAVGTNLGLRILRFFL